MTAGRINTEVSNAALLGITCRIPENAVTAPLLGTERAGHCIRLRPDGLAVTVGYLVTEAEQVWMSNRDGLASPAYVVAQDHDSGLSLVKPTQPLGDACLPEGSIAQVDTGDPAAVLRYGYDTPYPCEVTAKQEFAGRWEYLLDEALYTSPACDDWAGAALVDREGRLCGVGSLMLEMPGPDGSPMQANLFIPVELVLPHLDELCRHGQRQRPPRPWLGALIQEHGDRLVVVGTYPDCPADRAGIEPGDVLVSVDEQPVKRLGEFLRRVWRQGEAGVAVPLTLMRDGDLHSVRPVTTDRAAYYHTHAIDSWN